MRSAVLGVCLLTSVAGCPTSGALELDLTLPTVDNLRPTGMTSVSVVATSPDIGTISNTSILNGQSFSAGSFPVGTGIQIDVLFHDVSNRLVGVGEAASLVDIVGDKTTTLSIPVRRPFVYASSGTKLYTYDPTRDPRDAMFQGSLTGLTAPQLAVSVGGERLVVADANQLQIIDTSTHMVTGSPIMLPGMIHDAAPVPGHNSIAVATSMGISIVDLDTMAVNSANGPSVDKVTVGPTTDNHMVAFGLVGRVAPPAGPVDPCTGTSMIVSVDVDAPAAATPMALPQAIADIAASPTAPMLFAALPCANKVARLDGSTFTDVAMLERAAVLTVAGERVWAAGTHASMPSCSNAAGNPVACTAAATADCAVTSGTTIDYVTTGGHLIVQSTPIDGGTPVTIDVPEPRETMVSSDDPARQHAQVLRTLAMEPLDLVTLPGGQYVSLVTRNTFYITALVDQNSGTMILPCLKTTTGDWILMDMASSSVANRVRTKCELGVGPHPGNTLFPNWECEAAPEGQTPKLGEFQPTSIGALFGAR